MAVVKGGTTTNPCCCIQAVAAWQSQHLHSPTQRLRNEDPVDYNIKEVVAAKRRGKKAQQRVQALAAVTNLQLEPQPGSPQQQTPPANPHTVQNAVSPFTSPEWTPGAGGKRHAAGASKPKTARRMKCAEQKGAGRSRKRFKPAVAVDGVQQEPTGPILESNDEL